MKTTYAKKPQAAPNTPIRKKLLYYNGVYWKTYIENGLKDGKFKDGRLKANDTNFYSWLVDKERKLRQPAQDYLAQLGYVPFVKQVRTIKKERTERIQKNTDSDDLAKLVREEFIRKIRGSFKECDA